MPRWLVQITAPSVELRELRDWFQHGDVHLVQREGHTYLTGSALESIDDPFAAQRIARDAIADFSTISEVCFGHLNPPEISGYFEVEAAGEIRQHHFPEASHVVLFPRIQQREEAGDGTTFQEQLLNAAHASIHLTTATRLWARPNRSWARLYRIFEELEKHICGRLPSVGICSEETRTRFKRSANQAEVAGDGSRHAYSSYKPPPIPMDHLSAESFVGYCLRDTIRYQAGEFPNKTV